MDTALTIISLLLIAIVLLQSNNASDSSQIITGGNQILMSNIKERGAQKFITRATYLLGFLFLLLSLILTLR